MTRRLIAAAAATIAALGLTVGTASAETIKPSHGQVKTLMCYQYTPGSWITVYVPSTQVDKDIAKGDWLFGQCLPA